MYIVYGCKFDRNLLNDHFDVSLIFALAEEWWRASYILPEKAYMYLVHSYIGIVRITLDIRNRGNTVKKFRLNVTLET